MLAACIAIAFSQLAIEQHTALMAFYGAVGTSRESRDKRTRALTSLLGCSTSRCPRFQSNQPCTGDGLTCSGGNVTILYDLRAVGPLC
jgi:hypothetical protein